MYLLCERVGVKVLPMFKESIMLKVNQLYHAYEKDHPVLRGVDFEACHGEALALLGPNGSGKTTLIKLICDLLEIQKGDVRLNGFENDRYDVKKSILYLPSDDILPEFLKGREYVKLLMNLFEKEYDENNFLKLSEMYSFTPALNVMIGEYSNGMKKKIQLISAFMVDPEVMIIDETLNGMDVESQEITKSLLKKYSNSDNILIMCSHDLHLLEEICDKAIMLYQGDIYMQASMEKINRENGLLSVFREAVNEGNPL